MTLFLVQNAHTQTVTLAESVLSRVRVLALRIEHENRRKRRVDQQGMRVSPDESLRLRISGYAGEAAVAHVLGYEYAALEDHWRDGPDVGAYNVRTTRLRRGKLIVTPRDPVHLPYALVIDEMPHFHVCGFIFGRDAQRDEWWEQHRERGGAWYVPQAFLKALVPDPLGTKQKDHDDETRALIEETVTKRPDLPVDALTRGDWRSVLRAAGAEPAPPESDPPPPTHPPTTHDGDGTPHAR